MKLEIKRNNISTFIISTIVISIVMLGFIYLIAYAPQLEPNDSEMNLFAGYNNIISLFSVLTMSCFCVLSAVMYSRFVIEEYTGKRAILLFSYPISRSKIFISKVVVVSLFTMLAMAICNIVVFTIFGVTENIFSLVSESITSEIIIKAVKTTFVMSVSAAALGVVSMGIGFISKSVPATIISSVLLCSLLCNIVASTLVSVNPTIIFMAVTIAVEIIVTYILIRKVDYMEVE